MIYRFIIFLLLNFGALAIGGFFTGPGVTSSWYKDLAQAPWNPPGWVFGFAWTFIMICFTFYMSYLWPLIDNKKFLIALFLAQWILNIIWNPTFFYYHNITISLFFIVSLTILVGFFMYYFWTTLNFKSLLILPYFVWLLIATSLNAYIYLKN